MASQPSQRPRRNASPASSSKPQPMRAIFPFTLVANPSPTRGTGHRRPSPSSSPVHGSENGLRPRRTSPETRGSPEHRRSPSSPSSSSSKGERNKVTKSNSVSAIRRTSSLDAISAPYLSGHWPKEVGSYGPSMCHKATQTPAWEDSEIEENRGTRHKRSNSCGSADKNIREKFKQHLQRTKQGSKSGQVYGRQSPLHGDHSAIQATKLGQSIPISIPVAPRQAEGPQKRSLEGLNSEIQKLVLTDTQTDRILDQVPDGRKAPVVEMLAGTVPFRTVNIHTQTPADNPDGQESGGSGNSSSRSHSASPSYPIMPGTSDSRPSSRCSSGGAVEAEENVSPELPAGGPKYASSPKPNNSYLFAREPPDGAEKVPLHVEDVDRGTPLIPHGPDKTKVKIIYSHADSAFSAFSTLPSYPKMAVTSPALTSQQMSPMEATP